MRIAIVLAFCVVLIAVCDAAMGGNWGGKCKDVMKNKTDEEKALMKKCRGGGKKEDKATAAGDDGDEGETKKSEGKGKKGGKGGRGGGGMKMQMCLMKEKKIMVDGALNVDNLYKEMETKFPADVAATFKTEFGKCHTDDASKKYTSKVDFIPLGMCMFSSLRKACAVDKKDDEDD